MIMIIIIILYQNHSTQVTRVRVIPYYGTNSANTAAIQQRATAVLRSIPKQAFTNSFQKIYERCQQCVVNDGDYFEGQ
jgi:hypothetical protein